MGRTEQFALGVALVTAALTILLKKECLAWILFCIGLGFIFASYVLDLIFGRIRPSREQIEEMSADDYKKLLCNRKSKRWINILDWWKAHQLS